MDLVRTWAMQATLLAVFGLALPAASVAANSTTGGGGGIGYSCSKDLGGIGTCTCTTVEDCDRMKGSGACGKGTIVLGCTSASCTCPWVPKGSVVKKPPPHTPIGTTTQEKMLK
jgi:hypothetical protein